MCTLNGVRGHRYPLVTDSEVLEGRTRPGQQTPEKNAILSDQITVVRCVAAVPSGGCIQEVDGGGNVHVDGEVAKGE